MNDKDERENLTSEQFVAIFKQPNADPKRGKFLSRVLGIFSEEIVHIWAGDKRAPYENLGRPTLRRPDTDRIPPLDFTFRCRKTGKTYPAEMKCEIEFQQYKFLVLNDISQLDHHKKPGFVALRDAALKRGDLRAYVDKREVPIDGAILVWGAATPAGRTAVIQGYGFADVLTLADIVADLQRWRNVAYQDLLKRRRSWSNEMFDAFLAAPWLDA